MSEHEETNGTSAPSLPFVKGSETSEAAAKSMRKAAVGDEARVYAFFEKMGTYGATDKEIEAALGMGHESASARRNGLVRKGKVKNSGDKRLSPSKHKVIVWVLGKGIPVEGAKNHRSGRPTDARIREAVENMRELILLAKTNPNISDASTEHLVRDDLAALLAWLDRTAAK